jgi:hypothetical protein
MTPNTIYRYFTISCRGTAKTENTKNTVTKTTAAPIVEKRNTPSVKPR